MKKRELAVAVAVLAVFALARGRALFLPFILPFETAFQESIALHHLTNGVVANHFLSVTATIDGDNFYHTSHPPLLQIVYSLLYKIVGVREWVTRFFSVALWFGSALLWRGLLGREARRGWFVFPLAFALPLGFLLCATTNYELLSIFMISLIGWLTLARGSGLLVLTPALAVGLLVDWPVYLAVPALLALKWRDRDARRRLIILLALEVVFFVALQLYQYGIAGEAAFFSHAPERANPFALFAAETWRELAAHFVSIMDAPLAIISGAVIMAGLFSFRARSGDVPARSYSSAFKFFGLFILLLMVSAPRLVSRHEVYLLYFVPLLVFGFHRLLSRVHSPRLALAALIMLCLSRDYILHQARSPAYFGMADRLKNAGVETAFSSSAIGAWYFYNGTETVFPVSIKGADWVKTHRPDLVQTDLAGDGPGLDGGGRILYRFPGESVRVSDRVFSRVQEYAVSEAGVFVMAGPGRDCPGGTYIQARPRYGINISRCRVASYGLCQPPGRSGASSRVRLGRDGREVEAVRLRPAIIHSLPPVRSDGVVFMVVSRPGDDGGDRSSALVYARFVGSAGEAVAPVELAWPGSGGLDLVTTPGVRGNWSFDDAYWLEPTVIRSPAAE